MTSCPLSMLIKKHTFGTFSLFYICNAYKKGPPGAGKSFLGRKVVEILMSMKTPLKTPVLVMTYKNHALDEFLKGLVDDNVCSVDEICRFIVLSWLPKKNVFLLLLFFFVPDNLNCIESTVEIVLEMYFFLYLNH